MGALFRNVPKTAILIKNDHFWPNLAPKTNFSGKMTILSYKTIFLGLLLVQFYKICWSHFFRNVPKTAILAKNGHFFAHLAKFGQNEIFSQKKGSAIFLPLLSPNFMPSFGIFGAVSEINFMTDLPTYRQGLYITLVRPYVRASVTQLISKTASRIFPKLGMNLGDNNGKKIARPDFFRKIVILLKFGLTCEKVAIFGQNRSF